MRSRQHILRNKVDAMSVESIISKAFGTRSLIRKVLKSETPLLDTLGFLEALHNAELLTLEVVEFEEMPNEYALTYPQQKIITLRNDTYKSALAGEHQGRFTVAHEIGHLILHAHTVPKFARSQAPSNHNFNEDVEWQADEFARWLMVDPAYPDMLKTPRACSQGFGVSFGTAQYMIDKIKRLEGQLKRASL